MPLVTQCYMPLVTHMPHVPIYATRGVIAQSQTRLTQFGALFEKIIMQNLTRNFDTILYTFEANDKLRHGYTTSTHTVDKFDSLLHAVDKIDNF